MEKIKKVKKVKDLLSHNSDFFFLAIASLSKKSQNCEIKSRSNLFYFCIQCRKRASIETCQMS